MRKTQGTALVQYAIIILLIGGSLVPMIMLYGEIIRASLKKQLQSYSLTTRNAKNNARINNPELISKIQSESIQASDLGGSLDRPVMQCSGSKCSIDFGEYVINGIPDNFSDFVESSGTSGGTDKLAFLLEQMAQILETRDNPSAAENFRILADLGHFIASAEDTVEQGANNCADEADYKTCMKSFMSTEKFTFDAPPGLQQLPVFQNRSHKNATIENEQDNFFRFGTHGAKCNMNSITYDAGRCDEYTETLYTANFAKRYFEVVYDDTGKYPDEMKAMTEVIAHEIMDMAYDLDLRMFNAAMTCCNK